VQTVSPIVVVGSLVIAFVNFTRSASGKDWSACATQLLAWAAGIAAVMLAAQTDIADGVAVLGGIPLSTANAWSQVLVGLTAASAGGVFVNLTKALDNSDSATFPKLLAPKGQHHVHTGSVTVTETVPDARPPEQL
jgi:hypothetical protein